MKKIIICFTFLCSIFLCSCYGVLVEGDTIDKVEKSGTHEDKQELYESHNGATFYAKIGTYSVGDTIKFTK